MAEWFETGHITVRGTAERYGNSASWGNARMRIEILQEAGLLNRKCGAKGTTTPVRGMAVDKAGVVYREVRMS